MNPPPKILGLCGSLRTGSSNLNVLKVILDMARSAGADVTELPQDSIDLPTYNQDIEDQGFPPKVQALREAVLATDVLVIVSPEYNHSIPGGLKNALDWLSRGGNVLKGKRAMILGVSNGAYGTIRMQPHLRQVLGALDVSIPPQPQIMIGPANEKLAPDGSLLDSKIQERLSVLLQKVL